MNTLSIKKNIDSLKINYYIKEYGNLYKGLRLSYRKIDSTQIEYREYALKYNEQTLLSDIENKYVEKINIKFNENDLPITSHAMLSTKYYINLYDKRYNYKPPFQRDYNKDWIDFNYTYEYEYYE